ncbi:BAHD acyltransferase DCR [Selaginella moellendorffii]|nr:BAHD acyltransferase DCR [Selaginella moellendorffii]|eukprot:XP_002987181.2 BAHD acyltransferase DCR [Selaginella moellendorffii]
MSGRIFCFERDYIDKIKEMAGAGLSSFKVLSAHIWINMCAARDLPDSTSTTNSMAANCRKRLAPQLPDEFFGNAVLHAVSTTTAGELRKGGLRHAASLLEDAVSTSFGMEGITKKLSSKGIAADKLGKNCNMLCSSSPRFRYYEIDLGWGRPEAVRHVGLERLGLDGLCMFNPHPRSPQGIEVTITLPTGTLERLRRLLEDAWSAYLSCETK